MRTAVSPRDASIEKPPISVAITFEFDANSIVAEENFEHVIHIAKISLANFDSKKISMENAEKSATNFAPEKIPRLLSANCDKT